MTADVLPTPPYPSKIEWRLITATQTFESPLTGSVATHELPGARWGVRLTYSSLTGEEAQILQGFLFSQRGAAGRFKFFVPAQAPFAADPPHILMRRTGDADLGGYFYERASQPNDGFVSTHRGGDQRLYHLSRSPGGGFTLSPRGDSVFITTAAKLTQHYRRPTMHDVPRGGWCFRDDYASYIGKKPIPNPMIGSWLNQDGTLLFADTEPHPRKLDHSDIRNPAKKQYGRGTSLIGKSAAGERLFMIYGDYFVEWEMVSSFIVHHAGWSAATKFAVKTRTIKYLASNLPDDMVIPEHALIYLTVLPPDTGTPFGVSDPKPFGVFRLADDNQARMQLTGSGLLGTAIFEITEARDE